MKYAVYLPNFGPFADPKRLIQFAQEAEAAGWDGVFIWDHLTRSAKLPVGDPWILMSALAMGTKRVRLGALVTPLARRRPWKVARELGTLDHLSGGRMIFGAGLGGGSGVDVEWSHFGEEMVPKVRAAMLDEGLEILSGLCSGEPFSHQGEHFQVEESQFLPAAVQTPRVPIWVAGYWPNKAPFRRAARWDGMFPLMAGGGDDVAKFGECVQFANSLRDDNGSAFDVVHLHDPIWDDKEAEETTHAYAEAGATWWLEMMAPQAFGVGWTETWPVDKVMARIQRGPLRI